MMLSAPGAGSAPDAGTTFGEAGTAEAETSRSFVSLVMGVVLFILEPDFLIWEIRLEAYLANSSSSPIVPRRVTGCWSGYLAARRSRCRKCPATDLSLIHISEPTRQAE